MTEYITKNNNEQKMRVYYDYKNDEYLPLADIGDMYGPDYNPRIGISPSTNTVPKDYLLQIYIGSLGVLGMVVLYKFFEKS